jgi:hypothetical protein
MLGQLLLRLYHGTTCLECLFSHLMSLQLFFASLSLLHLRFDSIMLSKCNIMNSKIRENNTTQVTMVTA